MVYMRCCRRRIHYHLRQLLDTKQEINTDNTVVFPVCLMELFINELCKENRKLSTNPHALKRPDHSHPPEPPLPPLSRDRAVSTASQKDYVGSFGLGLLAPLTL